MSLPNREVDQMSADEAGRTGNRQFHRGDHSIGSPDPASSTLLAPSRSSSASSTGSMPMLPAALSGYTFRPLASNSSDERAAVNSSSSVSILFRPSTTGLSASPAP